MKAARLKEKAGNKMKAVKLQGKVAAKQVQKAAEKKPGSKPKKKAKQKKPIASQAKKLSASLDKKAAVLIVELNGLRKKIVENESILAKNIAEKIRAEDALNAMLSKSFEEEKALLASIKAGSQKKQESLKHKISSLESIAKIYEEKSARIDEAKRKHAALKRQLELIEKHAGV
jgi:hypothetical protein